MNEQKRTYDKYDNMVLMERRTGKVFRRYKYYDHMLRMLDGIERSCGNVTQDADDEIRRISRQGKITGCAC